MSYWLFNRDGCTVMVYYNPHIVGQDFIRIYPKQSFGPSFRCSFEFSPPQVGQKRSHNQGMSRRHRSRARRSSKLIRSNHSWRSCASETARWSGGEKCAFIIHVAGESRKYIYIWSTCVCVCIHIYIYGCICIMLYKYMYMLVTV